MDNLPARSLLLQHDGAPIEEPGAVIRVECGDGDISGDLQFKISCLNVHVRSLSPTRANAIEYLLKVSLNIFATIGAVWKLARVKHGRVIRKEGSETVPVQIVECANEIGESCTHFGFCTG